MQEKQQALDLARQQEATWNEVQKGMVQPVETATEQASAEAVPTAAQVTEVQRAEAKNHNSKHDIKALAKEIGVSAKRIQRVIDFANQVGVKLNFANVTRTQGNAGAFTNADNIAKDRTITLSKYQLAKGMAIEWVMGHELTHQIKADGNAANWEAYKQAIINALGQDAFDKRVKEQSKVYREAGAYRDMSANEFVEIMQEEVCADAAGDMLLNPDNMNKVMGVPQSLASRIWNGLKNMVTFSTPTRIKQAVDAWQMLAGGKEQEVKYSIPKEPIGRSLAADEAEILITDMKENADIAPELEFSIENWLSEFGKDGLVTTPIGKVKMGENQIAKLLNKNREKRFGLIRPTLQTPDVIIEKHAPAEGAERESKFLFIKTFVKPDGSRFIHFESVTVLKDGMDVSISSHEIGDKALRKEMQNGTILHLSEKLSSSSEKYLTETPEERPDLIPTSDNRLVISSSLGGGVSPISHADDAAPAISLQSRNDDELSASKDTQSVSTEQTDKKEISEKSAESNVEVTNEEVMHSISPIEGYTYSEVIDMVQNDVENILSEEGIDNVEAVEFWAHGSRMRGNAKEDSDLDVVMFYKGNEKEDSLFNLINGHELAIDGIKVDVNPIRISNEQDIARYKEKSARYDQEMRFSLSAEEQDIVDAAKADGTYMKTPNGKPTNLNEKQWAQVRTKAFKEWFGDWENDPENASKVVDENGEPMVVYHYTPNEFTEFDTEKIGSSTDVGALGRGFYFSPSDKFTLYGDKKMALFVNAKNPMLLNDSNAFEAKEPFFKADYKWDNESAQAFADDVQAKGYDAVYYENRGMDEIVAFRPTQIKSATDNVGTFDAENADIRYSMPGHSIASRIYGHPFTGAWQKFLQRAPKGVLKPGYGIIDESRLPEFADWYRMLVPEAEEYKEFVSLFLEDATATEKKHIQSVMDRVDKIVDDYRRLAEGDNSVLSLENNARFSITPDILAANERFNEELDEYIKKGTKANFVFHIGRPLGIMKLFFPELPIVMRPRVINKASNTKHDVDAASLYNLPQYIAEPIFVFQREDGAIGILTEMMDNNGKNVCVAVELNKKIQDGGAYLDVNDIRSIHGRDVKNIVLPIIHNNTLKYADKKKALDWFSSASSIYQQEITSQELSDATKIVQDFQNPPLPVDESSQNVENAKPGVQKYSITPEQMQEMTGGKLDGKNYGKVANAINPIARFLYGQRVSQYAPYRSVIPEPTLDDYYIATETTFEAQEGGYQEWEEMKQSGKYELQQSPKSSSEYLIDRETGDIYRFSDHWGGVASCNWHLEGGKGDGEYTIAKSNIKDFKAYNPRYSGGYVAKNPDFEIFVDKYKQVLDLATQNYTTLLNSGVQIGKAEEKRIQKAIEQQESLRNALAKNQYVARHNEIMYSLPARPAIPKRNEGEGIMEYAERVANATEAQKAWDVANKTAMDIDRQIKNSEEYRDILAANERFNEELDEFKAKTHKGLLHLGKPGAILRTIGVDADEMTISPTILHQHLKEHGLTVDDIKGLALSVQSPILAYRHGLKYPNLVIVTEMDVKGGKLSVSLELDGDGHIVAISNIKSVHSKDAIKEVERLMDMGAESLRDNLKWVEKEEVSDWLLRLPYEDERTKDNPKLSSVANVLLSFQNPPIIGDESSQNVENAKSGEQKYSLPGRPATPKRNEGESIMEYAQRVANATEAQKAWDVANKTAMDIDRQIKNSEEYRDILAQKEPQTIEEAASVALAGGKLLWNDHVDGTKVSKGAKSMMGWGEGERQRFFAMFASKENGGVSVEQMGEAVMDICSQYNIPVDETDAMAGTNAVLEVLQSAQRPSDITGCELLSN